MRGKQFRILIMFFWSMGKLVPIFIVIDIASLAHGFCLQGRIYLHKYASNGIICIGRGWFPMKTKTYFKKYLQKKIIGKTEENSFFRGRTCEWIFDIHIYECGFFGLVFIELFFFAVRFSVISKRVTNNNNTHKHTRLVRREDTNQHDEFWIFGVKLRYFTNCFSFLLVLEQTQFGLDFIKW